jgi:hypothetical protein
MWNCEFWILVAGTEEILTWRTEYSEPKFLEKIYREKFLAH